MLLVVSHPHPEQVEVLLVEWLLLMLLLESPERLQGLAGHWVLDLLKEELKRPRKVLMGKLEVGLGDSESS